MADFLTTILAHKHRMLAAQKDVYATLRKKAAAAPKNTAELFKTNISKPGQVNLIAEIKKASPSAGVIRKDFNIEAIARIYAQHKAAAISVLTEDKYFLGKPEDILTVTRRVNLPVLAKDFIISDGQIHEAKVNGAAAVLLIVAILGDSELNGLLNIAREFGLDCLVEVHDEKEFDRAMKAGAEIIGVNNRDLKTLDVNFKTSERLIPRIPGDKVVVAESGLRTHDDILRVRDLGAHAVLIGETFMRAKDIGRAIKEVMEGT
ncbi:MAG: indole-3-glycerol phosphate synthase TrpC [Candidatus Omnitrophica bacterium]|nr:indole-3-glycerol phosphate synthase TrpC [Candidatus Omnitrophota bacterium]